MTAVPPGTEEVTGVAARWSLISSVRFSSEYENLRVIVMTGLLGDAVVLNRAYELRSEYLGKPFAREALLAKVVSARDLVAPDPASLGEQVAQVTLMATIGE